MKIDVFAWGSLIWQPRSLPIATGFVPFGPVLPIEFSRVSGRNRFTLVIDEANGAPAGPALPKMLTPTSKGS